MTEWQYPLRRGASPDPKQGACLFDAVSWIKYGQLGDHPGCVDVALNSYGIAINDWLPYAERQRLVHFIPLLAGTANGPELERDRAEFIGRRAMEIAQGAGLRLLRRCDTRLTPIEAYERALLVCTWSLRDRLLYTPAIELLGEAIRLGQRAAPPLPEAAVAEGVLRFRLARAA